MVLLDNDAFLVELAKLYASARAAARADDAHQSSPPNNSISPAVTISIKQVTPQTLNKSRPKQAKLQVSAPEKPSNPSPVQNSSQSAPQAPILDPYVLIRATCEVKNAKLSDKSEKNDEKSGNLKTGNERKVEDGKMMKKWKRAAKKAERKGKRKISTAVAAKDQLKFQSSLSAVIKSNLTGLKKKQKLKQKQKSTSKVN